MATVSDLDSQWETQYQVVKQKKDDSITAMKALVESSAYQTGTEAEKEALGKTGKVEAARLAVDAETQTLTSIADELKAAESAEAVIAANESAAKIAESPEATVKTSGATNESASDVESANMMANSVVVGATSAITGAVDSLIAGSPTLSNIKNKVEQLGNLGRSAMQFLGGKKAVTAPAGVTVGNSEAKDLRVRIKVPFDYLYPLTGGTTANNELFTAHGIIFPYTPQISVDFKADYASASLTHSNFAVYFYKNSSVSPISISGKFTVQNQADAEVYLATMHLLRALTKMRFGTDTDAGAPPPVCQLNAYGDYMLDNVPVVISSFKNDLPDNVDYFGVNSATYGKTLVPIVSTVSVTCIPMYSRKEMLASSVTGWLTDTKGRKAGYL